MIKILKKIKNDIIIKLKFGIYKFTFVKNFNSYIHARKISFHNGFIFSFSKLTFISHSFRPVKSEDIKSSLVDIEDKSHFCIIIQGPIISNYSFTEETIKIYKKLHPGVLIILSTWDDTEKKIIEKLKKYNIILLLNKKPRNFGWNNINLQIFSTNEAIKLAKKNGSKYIAKTRTDCRVYSPNFLIYCKTLLDLFPNKNNKTRIISTDFSTKHLPYKLSDIFQFGKVEEMQKYWKKANWDTDIADLYNGRKIIEDIPIVSEVYLTTKYLMAQNYKLNWNLECWWSVLKDYFIIIDNNSIDLFWYKYDYEIEQRGARAYASLSPKGISHSEWLLMYSRTIEKWRLSEDPLFQERWLIDKEGNFKKINK